MKSILSPVPPADRAAGTDLGRLGCLALCSLLLAFSATTTQAADATPPNLMTYQGFLVDANGSVLAPDNPANYPVVFRIYEGSTGGSPVWTETQIVTIDKGNFSVLLGEGTVFGSEVRPSLSTVFSGTSASDRFIGITVTLEGVSTEILPRLRLLPAPYAFLARQANSLVDNSGAPLVAPGAGSELIVAGKLTANEVAGNGAALTSLNASQLASGTVPDARLSGNVALRNGGNTFNGNQTLNNSLGIGTAPSYRFHVADSGNIPGVFQSSSTIGTWLPLGNSSAGGQFWQMISSGSGNGEGAGRLLIGHGNSAGSTSIRMMVNPTGHAVTVNGALAIPGANVLEFGVGFTKQGDAGKIGYGTFVGNALNIVGAGTDGNNRRVQVYAEGGMNVTGPLSAGSVSGGNLSAGSLSAGSLSVNTGFGQTFQVVNDYAEIFNFSDKSRNAIMFRTAGGLYLRLRGGHVHGSGERSASYDGDSNWDFSSDRRLKKDIEDVEPMLDRALKVPIRRYRWKDEGDSAIHKLGVIAQEIQPLFPEMVAQTEDPDTQEATLTVGYSDFGMIAIKSIQELKTLHEAETTHLKSEIESLKSQVANLVRAQTALLERLDNGSVSTAAARR